MSVRPASTEKTLCAAPPKGDKRGNSFRTTLSADRRPWPCHRRHDGSTWCLRHPSCKQAGPKNNLIEMEDLKDIVLVGWSYGGMVASEVLARTTARIGAMVYLDAFVPERGKALVDYAGPPAERFRQAAAKGQDISAIPLGVFGVTDPAVIAHVTPRLSLQPAQTFVQPSKALAERPRIPHTYVRASGFASAGFDAFLKKFRKRAMNCVLDQSAVG